MSLGNDKTPLAPPSYTQSTIPHTHPLLNQIPLIQSTHIQFTISTHILPLLESRATLGLAQTTLALLPSDTRSAPTPASSESISPPESSAAKPVEIISFATDAQPKVVVLEGEMNSAEFWRVQAVVDELERVLRRVLNADSGADRVRSGDLGEGGPGTMAVAKGARRALVGRIVHGLGLERKSPGGYPEVGLREVGGGRVLVKARLEELCLRTVNEFGLYDTLAKQCVIVMVNARC
ncbi:hypothetical protein BDU57DRAFT_496447 [Ampelomyces quisqualis]|uniref:Uncharacterized protein n=1 Tax=Ampelomyces quisqualis TaxID=50730 RepID=A0A6A5QMY3_AMPQU|nr:hypothetical protein BDU57DRAFT_496447 [Ampelomyces quisqualis]